jgi:uncharacterized heparinase superfamily protein
MPRLSVKFGDKKVKKSGGLLKQVKDKVEAATYGNAIYRHILSHGPVPNALRFSFSDPWPGNANEGQAVLALPQTLFEDDQRDEPSVSPHPARLLRDLRAVGSEAARRKSVALVLKAVEALGSWHERAWQPAALGERLSAWISFYDFYAPMAPPEFQEKLIASLSQQLRHLLHLQPTFLPGTAGLAVVKGLVLGGLALGEEERALPAAFELLQKQIANEILDDGGHISRNPSTQLHFLRHLIDLRAALKQSGIGKLPEIDLAIDRMIPALKLFRHGDGALALFQGSAEESSLWLEATLTLSEARGRAARRLPQMGFERLTAGRSLLLADIGGVPPHPYDRDAHAGLLSFEFSVGRERIIVNCGAAPEGDAAWHQALAATAAHSTLTLEDTNAYDVLAGGLGRRPLEVKAQRFEQDGVQSIEMSHDGYASRFGVWHQRTLSLSPNGEELKGREILAGKVRHDYSIRWHLHPALQVSLSQSGQAALLRTPSGAGWRLRVLGGDLGLEHSVYSSGEAQRRNFQLRLSGHASANPTIVDWSLTREKR